MATTPEYDPYVQVDLSCLRPQELSSNNISKKMHQLTVEEREHALQVIHGVSSDDCIEETVDFLSEKLIQLEIELKKIPNKSYLELARKQSAEYVTKVAIQFLRAKMFHVEKVAVRLVRFFDLKKTLFGTERLGKDLTFADLPKEDREAFEIGSIQLLPQKDRAGRAVVMRFGEFGNAQGTETVVSVVCP